MGSHCRAPFCGRLSHAVVYFFQRSDRLVKIGTTRNVCQRRSAIESLAGPVRLIHIEFGSFEREHRLHERFSADRVFGEWFRPSGAVYSYVEAHRNVAETWFSDSGRAWALFGELAD